MSSRIHIRSVFALSTVLFGLLVASCGGSNPVAPGPAVAPAATSGGTAAQVSGVLPASFAPDQSNQTVMVAGSNFKPGLSVALTDSGGGVTTLNGPAIQSLTDTSFQLAVAVTQAGTYSLRVNNPAAPSSEPVTVTAQSMDTARPAIAGTSPRSPMQNGAGQTVYVGGSNFAPGMTVTLTLPDGTEAALASSQVQNVTATLFQMVVVLSQGGSYSMRVTSSSGQTSEPLYFTVQGTETAGPPAVTGLSPASPTQGATDQHLYVAGTGFQPGLSVSLTRPDGTTLAVGGSAITFSSATMFAMNAVLADAGTYSLRVTNPSGQASDPWTFSVSLPPPPSPPAITSLSPASPTQSSAPQTVYVAGLNLETGLSAVLTLPSGATTTIPASQVTFGSSSVFSMPVVLADAGTYSLKVVNPSGVASAPWTFTVQAVTLTPSIAGLSPRSPTAKSTSQTVYVGGTNFVSGMTVVLTLPGGATTTLDASQVQNLTPTTFQMNVVLADAGTCSLRVTTPAGSSSPWTFTVASGF